MARREVFEHGELVIMPSPAEITNYLYGGASPLEHVPRQVIEVLAEVLTNLALCCGSDEAFYIYYGFVEARVEAVLEVLDTGGHTLLAPPVDAPPTDLWTALAEGANVRLDPDGALAQVLMC